MVNQEDTICALSTPSGSGALGVIRLSGPEAISIANSIFKGRNLKEQKTQSLHFGEIINNEEILDEVLVSLFKNPKSFTGEDVVEISCHGSFYILSSVIELLIQQGARLARPGEFSQRAFLNGKMDLTQAEAVADLIASESKVAHELAMSQMKGGFSKKIQELRQELIQFTSLIELELDFAEEDVEFADREDLKTLVAHLLKMIGELIDSFSTGSVIKNGIPVAIIGEPNVGKSTLLNALLNEEKAIVSEIAGTTRDSIEDEIKIEGISFRFIDTAGIRETTDIVEKIGIERTYEVIKRAKIVLYLVDGVNGIDSDIQKAIKAIEDKIRGQEKKLLIISNKMDKLGVDIAKAPKEIQSKFTNTQEVIYLSALKNQSIDKLTDFLSQEAKNMLNGGSDVIVSNKRHHQALVQARDALLRVKNGLGENITGDFLAMDIRQALHFLGEITGTIEIDRDILGTIFSQFCIGK